jgi:NAD(P)-dependent dehydrogenase (short-subunit alcohol dehydrogenase family)
VSPTTPLVNKTAVIVGGTGGIGSAVAELLAQAGAAVAVVASRDIAEAEGIAATLSGSGHQGYACRIEDSPVI